jgi:hypothetical protein
MFVLALDVYLLYSLNNMNDQGGIQLRAVWSWEHFSFRHSQVFCTLHAKVCCYETISNRAVKPSTYQPFAHRTATMVHTGLLQPTSTLTRKTTLSSLADIVKIGFIHINAIDRLWDLHLPTNNCRQIKNCGNLSDTNLLSSTDEVRVWAVAD